MSTALDQIISVNISQQTAAVQQTSFASSAVFGPSNRFAKSTATTGNISNGLNTLTNIANLTGAVPGANVSGTGIPTGTYLLSVTGSSAIMSQNATATTTGVSIQFQDAIRQYTSLSGMTSDGFLTSDPEYVKAAELLEQAISPPNFYVGRNSASVAQVDNVTVNSLTGVPGHVYSFTINGQLVTYTSLGGNVQQDILNGLNAALAALTVPPATGVVTGSGGSANLALTSVTPGAALTYTAVDSELTVANITPNHTITADIQQAQLQNDAWYGLAICSNTDGDITQVATFTETLIKLFGASTSTAAVATSSTTDVASVLKGKTLKRTFLFFTSEPTEGKETALMGGQLPQTPGSNSWAFKSLVGCTPDVLSSNQQSILIGTPEAGVAGKNVNIYQTVGGVNITQMGTAIGGQFLDLTVGIDWLRSTLQTNVFSALVNAAKIPYTDPGTGVLMSAVKAALDQGVVNGLIDGNSPINITAPLVATVSPVQRANRVAPTISWSARLAGAFNGVVINGVVTV